MPRVMTFEDYDFSPDPRQLVAIYESGFKGVLPDAIQTAYMRRAAPTLYQAFSDAKEAGKGRLSLPYKAALTLDPDFGSYEAQTTGDCVSHASRSAITEAQRAVLYGPGVHHGGRLPLLESDGKTTQVLK